MKPAANVVLIGMPGAGKSTIGVLLAKALSRDFLDTDLVIQAREGKRLHELIAERGLAAFRELEERHVLDLAPACAVVATGGSVVYSERAMAHLQADGVVIWLDVPLPVLTRRLANYATRGIVIAPGQSLADLAAERQPLYERYADLRLPCGDLTHDQCVARILSVLPG